MPEDAGLVEIDRIRQLLRQQMKEEEPVVKLIRNAALENKADSAKNAIPEVVIDEYSHPAIASAVNAVSGLLFQVGKRVGTVRREHVLGVYDVLRDAEVHEGVLNRIGVQIFLLAQTRPFCDEVKFDENVMAFAKESIEVQRRSNVAAAMLDEVNPHRGRAHKPMPEHLLRGIRQREIELMAIELQTGTMFRKTIEHLRTGN